MSRECALNSDQWQHFPKTLVQEEFDYSLCTKLLNVNVARYFLPSSLKLKRENLPSLTK